MDARSWTWRVILAGVALLPVVASVPAMHAQHDDRAGLKALAQRGVAGADGATVCDAVRVPAGAFRRAGVIASVAYSGRTSCSEIVVLSDTDPPEVIQRLDANGASDLSEAVQGVTRSGELLLRVPQAFSPYEGGDACTAIFPAIYQCSASQCRDVSGDQRDFYNRRIAALRREVIRLQQPGPGDDRRRQPCAQMELDKIRRLVGPDRRVGFTLAEDWMTDPSPLLRAKAVAVFADIGDTASRRYLEQMKGDADGVVADQAAVRLRILLETARR
jgi:hypothetical protein